MKKHTGGKNDAELETIEKLYENLFEKLLLLKNAGFYLEEALLNQTHDEVIRFLYRNFEFSENVTDDRKYMMLALENSNPDITRLYLDNCGDK